MSPARTVSLVAWMTVPLLWVGWHYGPGHEALARDHASVHLKSAQAAFASGSYEEVIASVEQALASLPESERETNLRLRVLRSQARMQSGELFEARDELPGLVQEAEKLPGATALAATARETLATAQYYTTWLMRLEGLPREEWEEEAEATRQNFRLLAEKSSSGSALQAAFQEKLESSIKLARMELTDLQGLPLPKQCNCKKPGKGKCKKPGKKPGQNKPEDSRGAGKGPPVDGGGY